MQQQYKSEVNREVAPAALGEFRPLAIGPLAVWPPVVRAPMAGITNYPFRTICRQYGAGLYVSEMITARALVARNPKTLRLAGFKAPQNIAWGALGSGAEYLISTAVPGHGVDDWLRRQLPPGDPSLFKTRRQLLSDLGQAVGRLHHTGFVHGDMRTGNVLADYRGGRFHFAYIDNERNSRHKVAPGKFVARNLMQLNMHTPQELSRSERWVFFQAWRRQMRELSETEANVLARESFAWAMRRLAAKGKLVTSQ